MSSFYILDGAQASLSKWWQLGLLFHFCFIFILSILCCFACLFISCMQWLCLMNTHNNTAQSQSQLHILSLYRIRTQYGAHLRDLLCLTAAAGKSLFITKTPTHNVLLFFSLSFLTQPGRTSICPN
ncbi:hypothetical protein M431DRAFT_213117 [Trichoderma harzianum CBS 226.95]|uniref:Uncharacterized protein n=1 Tax=Trichoderma harzianum CBS 226.95 TaxID=983964 RepID=A0A2T4A5A6_TRIHA|nr:hypothetical protein M431DRAFT_213117 [Trichoderma harzianum CBS 226.95]PTB52218.1 hypothetical protein M431DRAFT_213117 [Trichoderma harzianum CBS 226.95]